MLLQGKDDQKILQGILFIT